MTGKEKCIFNIKIVDIVISIEANYIETRDFFSKFLTKEKAIEYVKISKYEIEMFSKKIPNFTKQMCEKAILKYYIDKIAVDYDAFPFHASAISYKGDGYVFTALSGVGKSTHVKIWKETFGKDVIIINDDRPYLKVVGNRVYIYSHPQSGKHNLYNNTKCEVKIIGKIIRDDRNFIKRIPKSEMFPFLVQQTFTMDKPEITLKIVSLLKKVLNCTQFYEIHCNMDSDSANLIYNQIVKDMN